MRRHIVEVDEFEAFGGLLDMTIDTSVSDDPEIPRFVISYSVEDTYTADKNGNGICITGDISCFFDHAIDTRLRQAILDAIEEEEEE